MEAPKRTIKEKIIQKISVKNAKQSKAERFITFVKKHRFGFLVILSVLAFGIFVLLFALSTFGSDSKKFVPKNPAEPVGDGETIIRIKSLCPNPIWLNIEDTERPQFIFAKTDPGNPDKVYEYHVNSFWDGLITANFESPATKRLDTRDVIPFVVTRDADGHNVINYHGEYNKWISLPYQAKAVRSDGNCPLAGCKIPYEDLVENCPVIGRGNDATKLVSEDGLRCVSPAYYCSNKVNYDARTWCKEWFGGAIDYCVNHTTDYKPTHPHCAGAYHPGDGTLRATSINPLACASNPHTQDSTRNIPFADNELFSGALDSSIPNPEEDGGRFLCAAINRGIIDTPDASVDEFYENGVYPSNPWAKWIHRELNCDNVWAFPFDYIGDKHGAGTHMNIAQCSDVQYLDVVFCPLDDPTE